MMYDTASSWLWKTVSPIILLFGVIGNSLIIYILIKMDFWKKTTYLFLFILALSDLTVLSVGLLRRWMLELFDVDIRNLSNIGCKVNLFSVYFSMHISAWTLVCVSVERYIKVHFPFRFITSDIPRKLIISYIAIFLVCIGVNCHFFWTNGLIDTEYGQHCNNTSDDYYIFEEKYFSIIDLFLMSVIPFIVMFSMNIMIGKDLQRSRKFRTNIRICNHTNTFTNSSRRLTRMLFLTNIYFLCTTLPVSILFVLDSYLTSEVSQPVLSLATTVFYLLQYSNYAVNFFIYVLINMQFRRHLPKAIFTMLHYYKNKSKTMNISSVTDLPDNVHNAPVYKCKAHM